MDNTQNLKTVAFISYSRSDRAVAIDLLKKIERYAYPREWVAAEDQPYDEKFVRPIFLDLADLSTQARDFTEEIRQRLAATRYLIVICTQHSAKSDFVQREINYFLKTHDNNPDLICAVYVDKIFNGMHPVIDEIVATRNCPIYVTGRGDAGHTGRKYCLHHILEFLLKVEFAKLYNRYEEYRRRKQRQRSSALGIFLGIIFIAMGWIIFSEHRRASIEHARVEFERGTFPYSLVVGYVSNFLQPTMQLLNDSLSDQRAHMFIYMPSDSTDLIDSTRAHKYGRYLRHHYPFERYATEELKIPGRWRRASITRLHFTDDRLPIYKDDARTITAFKYVIDYKLSPRNPVQLHRPDPQNFLTDLYTDSFIAYTRRLLPEYESQLHFVKDTIEFGHILDSLFSTLPPTE